MDKKIAVIGAGPMGLAVAYQLVLDGYIPVIYEADNRIGGMSATFMFCGLSIERFYHFHCTSDVAFFDLLKELGLGDKLRWKKTKMGYWYNGKLQKWGSPISLLSFDGISFLSKVRYAAHVFISSKRSDWSKLDSLNATDWIKKWVGEEAWRVLWAPLFAYKFYRFADQISAAWIWSRIRRLAISRYNIFHEKLGYLEGGSDTFLHSIHEYIISRGGEFHLDSRVDKVNISEGKICSVVVDGVVHYHDVVISTVPLPYVPDMIPDIGAKAIEFYKAMDNIAVVCVVVKCKTQFSDNFWININDPAMDIPGLIEYTNLRPIGHGIIYVPFYMPQDYYQYREADNYFKDKVISYLSTINPKFNKNTIEGMHVSRYRFAQPICKANFLSKLPCYKPDVDGLWVADTSHYYPDDRGISESIGFGRKLAVEAVSYLK